MARGEDRHLETEPLAECLLALCVELQEFTGTFDALSERYSTASDDDPLLDCPPRVSSGKSVTDLVDSIAHAVGKLPNVRDLCLGRLLPSDLRTAIDAIGEPLDQIVCALDELRYQIHRERGGDDDQTEGRTQLRDLVLACQQQLVGLERLVPADQPKRPERPIITPGTNLQLGISEEGNRTYSDGCRVWFCIEFANLESSVSGFRVFALGASGLIIERSDYYGPVEARHIAECFFQAIARDRIHGFTMQLL